jgi:hypothetical protein
VRLTTDEPRKKEPKGMEVVLLLPPRERTKTALVPTTEHRNYSLSGGVTKGDEDVREHAVNRLRRPS